MRFSCVTRWRVLVLPNRCPRFRILNYDPFRHPRYSHVRQPSCIRSVLAQRILALRCRLWRRSIYSRRHDEPVAEAGPVAQAASIDAIERRLGDDTRIGAAPATRASASIDAIERRLGDTRCIVRQSSVVDKTGRRARRNFRFLYGVPKYHPASVGRGSLDGRPATDDR